MTLTLTPRERQVWRLAALGATTGSIGTTLGIRYYTVRNHMEALYLKLNLSCRVELTMAAVLHGIISHDDMRAALSARALEVG